MDMQMAFRKLSEMHKKQGIIWTLGTGEYFKKQYAGVATPKPTSRLFDPANDIDIWIRGDNLQAVLFRMVKQAEKYIGGKHG